MNPNKQNDDTKEIENDWEETLAFYRSMNIDSKEYKFDREEANEREIYVHNPSSSYSNPEKANDGLK
ncbi:MAG: hypothetical protein AAF806_26990 [Bacteroidota bacterium]